VCVCVCMCVCVCEMCTLEQTFVTQPLSRWWETRVYMTYAPFVNLSMINVVLPMNSLLHASDQLQVFAP